MSRSSKKNTLRIKYVFPKDYEIFDLAVEDSKTGEEEITSKGTEEDKISDFEMHPEYDLYFKKINKDYSEKDIITVYELYKKGSSELYFRSHGKFEWLDYLLQIPGIYEILGIKRNFFIGHFNDIVLEP